jgi:AraC family transcriptional regulator
LSAENSRLPRPIFDVPPEHIVRSSKDKAWDGFDVAEIIHPLDDFALPAIPRHILVVNLSAPTTIHERLGGQQSHLGTGHVVFLPAEAPTAWHLDHEGEVRHVHLYLFPSLVDKVAVEADLNPDRLELVNVMGIQDAVAELVAMSLLSELGHNSLGGKLYADSLATMLTIHLLRHYSATKATLVPPVGRFSAKTLCRITDYIESHLADDLKLANLAAIIHLSPYHFAHLFKHTLHVSPHQYLIRRRVERVKYLLETTDWTLEYIALQVGFTSASQLAGHFRRSTGLSPGHYRRYAR